MTKAVGKILKILLLLMGVSFITLVSVSFLMRDKVTDMIIATINGRISSRLEIENVSFSLIRNFPKASVELKGVSLMSSPGTDKYMFPGINTDTLLKAKKLTVSFSISDILKNNYDIGNLSVSDGKIQMLTDTSGNINYRIMEADETDDSTALSIIFDKITLNNLEVVYINNLKKLKIEGMISEGRLSSRIRENYISVASEADILINKLHIDRIKSDKPFHAGIDLKMENSEKGLNISQGILHMEGIMFKVKGDILPDDFLNLRFDAENIDLSKVRKYLPPDYSEKIRNYEVSGRMNISGSLNGFYSKSVNPHFDLDCTLENTGIRYNPTGLNISELSLNFNYSNGTRNNQESAVLRINNIAGRVGTAHYSGRLKLINLHDPVVRLDMSGRIIPDELKQFFSIKEIGEASGFCDAVIRMETKIIPGKKPDVDDLIRMKPEADLTFSNFTLGIRRNGFLVSNINGKLRQMDFISADHLEFIYRNQKISIDGNFTGLPEWLAGYPVIMKADADIRFDKFIPGNFSVKRENKAKPQSKSAFSLPSDIFLRLRVKIDSLIYHRLPASDLTFRLDYKPGLVNFNSFNVKTLDGLISGNGYLVQNKNKSFLSKGIFNISAIDIKNTFNTFSNFGQDFIKAENLSGYLTGNLTLMIPTDSAMVPAKGEIAAEGKYVIENGELIDFEPLKNLSSFIEVSELENVRFEKLQNDFFIRDGNFYIPQMDVKSSAADLAVNGKHGFDNSFEYHVSIKLSELLSRKRSKTISGTSEFGVVEDDGLGRTTLFLKIESKGDEIKTGYDVKAAGEKVRAGIRTERKNLKRIINEEYGFFRKDSAQAEKPVEKKRRFRISWEEQDSTTDAITADTIKKNTTIRNFIRKK